MFKVYRKFYTEKDTIPGGIVTWHDLSLPDAGEYYIARETRQRFNWLWFPMYLRTELQVAHFPSEMMSFIHWLSDKDMAKLTNDSLIDFRKESVEHIKKAKSDLIARINTMSDKSEADRIDMTNYVSLASNRARYTIDPDITVYADTLKVFTDQGYIPLFKVGHGVDKRIYMAKMYEDRIAFYIVNLIGPLKNDRIILGRIETFHLTERVLKALDAHNHKKGVL